MSIAPSLSTFRIKPQISTFSLSDDVTNEVENIPGKLWVNKLRTAFDEADTDKKGSLTRFQFIQSRLRFLITGVRLNDMQMDHYFNQIDSNGIDQITWKELVDFMMSYQNSLTAKGAEKTLKIEFIGPPDKESSKFSRTQTCLRTIHVPLLNAIAVLSESSLIFYSLENFHPILTFSEKGTFVDCVYLTCLFKIAICKANREIIFYDVRAQEKMDFYIPASLDIKAVPYMNIAESRKASKWCHRKEIPLFNRSTAIGGYSKYPYIFVGDDKGRIEVFYISMTQIEGHYYWNSKRILVEQMHTNALTQISYLPTIKTFASSSLDGTIKLWKFNFKKNTLTNACSFTDPQKFAIRSFTFDSRTTDIVYRTSLPCFVSWRIYTENHTVIDTHSNIIQTMNVYQMSKNLSFLITITKTGFFTIYQMPGLEEVSNFFMGLMHNLCPPTNSLIIDKQFFLSGGFVSAWQLENGDWDGFRPHNYPVIGAFTNDVFSSVISVDNNGVVCNWNYVNGRKEYSYTLQEPGEKVQCVCLDQTQRRLAIGFSDGLVKIVSANSGSLLNEIDKSHIEGGCFNICFATIFDQKRILCCTGVKSVVLFEENSGSRTRFVRSFIGHTENVSRAIVLKNSRVLSIGNGQEMFLWKVQVQPPLLKFQLPKDPTTAVDIPDDESIFLVGDVDGFIHIMSMDDPIPLSTINCFHMSIKSPITCLTMCANYPLLVVANMHGYVKYYFYLGDRLEDFRQFRAHEDTTLSVSISQKMRIVVTAGRDEQIRMWSVEPFGLIGSFGRGKLWKINHLDMWESENPLEDDPTHFAEPPDISAQISNFQIEEEDIAEPKEEEEVREKFDYSKILELYDTTENINERGKKINEKAKVMVREPPLSERRSPRKPKFTYEKFMENRDFEGTIKSINKILRTQPKITIPDVIPK